MLICYVEMPMHADDWYQSFGAELYIKTVKNAIEVEGLAKRFGNFTAAGPRQLHRGAW
jgi:hypothetical protein